MRLVVCLLTAAGIAQENVPQPPLSVPAQQANHTSCMSVWSVPHEDAMHLSVSWANLQMIIMAFVEQAKFHVNAANARARGMLVKRTQPGLHSKHGIVDVLCQSTSLEALQLSLICHDMDGQAPLITQLRTCRMNAVWRYQRCLSMLMPADMAQA